MLTLKTQVFQRNEKLILLGFWTMIAVLELGQNYIDSVLNDKSFVFVESLAFKSFWLLFIPGIIVFTTLIDLIKNRFDQRAYWLVSIFASMGIILLHLMVFTLLLFVISALIHETGWSFDLILNEKLSTRLYITIACYALVVFVRPLVWSKDTEEGNDYIKQLSVRIGNKLVVVQVDQIKWFKSEGNYVALFTENRKYLIVDSLKHLLTQLDPNHFRRIHKSTIVNVASIQELNSRLNGDYDVILLGGEVLRLSRNYVKSVKGVLL